MPIDDIYHTGEIAVQERTGDRELALRRAEMFGDRLGEAARAFLHRQGIAAVGAAAPDGAIWASLWCGQSGFLRSGAPGDVVDVDLVSARMSAADPVRAIVSPLAPLGMLAIDLMTRQRLWVNGTVTHVDASRLAMHVRETFGNCPKYIQRRERSEGPAEPQSREEHGRELDAERLAFIARVDTLFVASVHPSRGLDVSHRGGEVGFVRVENTRMLRIPDYPGNGLYQTLGNFEVDSRAGLALIDFERRRVLSLTGTAVAAFDRADLEHPTGGTGRCWFFTMERWTEFPLPPATRWTLVERSPLNPRA